MAQRSTRRAALLATAVLAVPGVLLAVAAPADAGFRGGITGPNDGTHVSSHTTLALTAEVFRDSLVDGNPTSTLAVRLPGEANTRTLVQTNSWSNNRQVLSFSLNTACPAYPGTSCNGVPAKNGSYQVVLSGPVNQTRNFTVRVAPAPPSNARAEVTGERQITVTWSPNPEPDLVSYDLYGGSGDLIAGDLPTHPTSYTVTLPSRGYAGEHSFAVRARRAACPGCADTLTSPLSNAARVIVEEPSPEPDPSQSPGSGGEPGTGGGNGGEPGGGGSTGDPDDGYGSGGGNNGGTGGGNNGGTGGNGTGGNNGGTGGGAGNNGGFSSGGGSGGGGTNGGVAAPDPLTQQRRAFGLTFKSFSPKLGAPKLPPLPEFAEIEEPDGTFDPTIDYGDQEVLELAGSEQAGSVQTIIEDVVSTVFEGRRFWTSLAAGMVLMLGAGHVRVWLGAPEHD